MTCGAIAVFDIGKTNAKLLVFAAGGAILHARRTRPAWARAGGETVLDAEALFGWMRSSLTDAATRFGVRHVTVATHGCTVALLGVTPFGANGLAAPILDYEEPVPEAVEAEFERMRPPFAETGTPAMARGFACAKHMVWREGRDPGLAARVETILLYPQYWTWRFSGVRAGEVSSLGCHTHLWSPLRGDYSSLVDRRRWRAKMPPIRPAGAVLGETSNGIAVHNGVHDSNATLFHYRRLLGERVAVVSTGTWVVVMSPGADPHRLDPMRDMLLNVSVDGEPVPTARFMGGREFDLLRGACAPDVEPARLAAAVERGLMALPSFADGGPFPAAPGLIVDAAGHPFAADAHDRAALAALYVALMIDTALTALGGAERVVVDGGLARVSAIPALLAALRPHETVLLGAHAQGTAAGAARIAARAIGFDPFREERCVEVAAAAPPGLAAYAARWRQRAAARGQPPAAAPPAGNDNRNKGERTG